MRVQYFEDTDTLLVTLSSRPIVETRDLSEDVLVELDEAGHLVSMTIEHARQQTDLREFSYQLASGDDRDARTLDRNSISGHNGR